MTQIREQKEWSQYRVIQADLGVLELLSTQAGSVVAYTGASPEQRYSSAIVRFTNGLGVIIHWQYEEQPVDVYSRSFDWCALKFDGSAHTATIAEPQELGCAVTCADLTEMLKEMTNRASA